MNKLNFGDIEVRKKTFYESKIALKLSEVDKNKIVVSNKVKGNNETKNIFVGYMIDIDIIALCIVLPQMSRWTKYFESGGKNMSFKIEDDEVYIKYNSICNKIKELLGGLKLYSRTIYDDSYIKTKVKTFSDVIKTLFDGDKIPEERIEYLCMVCISIDSILRVDKKIIHKFI